MNNFYTRAMLRDEDRYEDPDIFNPSRYLTADGQLDASVRDPEETFGFGRRICPGRYFAKDVLFLSMANILTAFTIEKYLNEHGVVEEPQEAFSSGFFR